MLTRRNLLRAAVPSALLGGPLVAQALNVTPRRTARTCILVNLNGGASHVDTFDVKDGPWLPPDFNAQQAAPNIVLSKTLFPGLSGIGRDLCILRSVQSWEAAHDRGQFYLQTAHSSNPAFVGETPHMGAIVALEKGAAGLVPPFLALNVQTLQGAKFLGGLFEPMIAPLNANGIATLQHNYFGAQSQSRFETRYAALRAIDRGIAGAFADESMSASLLFTMPLSV